MTIRTTTHTVSKGECAWNVAQRTLQKKGGKVTTADITKEMQRLAKLNNCDSVEDFNKKFFSKVGSEFVIDKKEVQGQQQRSVPLLAPDTLNPDSTLRQDNTRVSRDTLVQRQDTTNIDKTIPQDSTLVKDKKQPAKPKLSPVQQEIADINNIKGDKNRIIEYNKKHAKGNYIIIDKKTCTATVYSKDGKQLDSYEVLLGQTRGDNLSAAFAKDASKRTYYTVPGEFEFSAKGSQHGGILYLGESGSTFDPDVEKREDMPGSGGKKKLGATFQALHGTANPKVRNQYYNNGTLADNRQSMGCVNIPVEALNEIQNKYGIGAGSSCYILPEDKGNELRLQEQKDGEIKFVTHYKDEVQNEKLARINDDLADKRIQKKLLAKQKAEQQEILAKEQKKEKFSILDPKTWFNFG